MPKIKIQTAFILLIVFLWSIIFIHSYDFSARTLSWKSVASDSAWLAWALLVMTIFIGLICKLFPKTRILKKMIPLRKYTGVFTFIIGISHAVIRLLYEKLSGNILSITEYLSTDISMILATIGGFIMIFPFITSTIWAVKKLGPKLWKNIQRLTHASFIFIAFHILALRGLEDLFIQAFVLAPLVVYVLGYVWLWGQKIRR